MKSFVYLRALRAFVVEILDGAACAHVDGKQLVRRRLRHAHQDRTPDLEADRFMEGVGRPAGVKLF
jgi:hypothetical protein